jgi:hypothetical protein
MTTRPLRSLLGLPRAAAPIHGHEVVAVELPGLGTVRLARRLQPEAGRAPASVEPERVGAMRAHLGAGDVALVIGSAGGGEALELGLAVGPAGAVVVLEADRALFPVLAANAALNRDWLRLHPHLVAVARAGALAPPFGIEALPLEAFLAARHAELLGRLRWVSFRFGAHGPSLLEALRPLLAARRPLLRVAVGRSARRPQRQALLSALGELGYRVEWFGGDGGPGAAPPTEASALRRPRLDLLAVP